MNECRFLGEPTGGTRVNIVAGKRFTLPLYSCRLYGETHERQCNICPDKCTENCEDTFLQKMANAAKAVGRAAVAAVSGQPVFVSEDVLAERLAMCRECPYCDKAEMKCTAKGCGCYLEGTPLTPGKARLATEDCPKGKWTEPA